MLHIKGNSVLCVPGVRELERPWEGSPGMGAERADAISRESGRGVSGKDLRQAIVKGGRNRGFKGGTITSGSDPSNTPESAMAQPCASYGANHTGMWGVWTRCHGSEKNWITEKCEGGLCDFCCYCLHFSPKQAPVTSSTISTVDSGSSPTAIQSVCSLPALQGTDAEGHL